MWQNNLIKFYLDHNVDKACELGDDLLENDNKNLNNNDLADLKFSLGVRFV